MTARRRSTAVSLPSLASPAARFVRVNLLPAAIILLGIYPGTPHRRRRHDLLSPVMRSNELRNGSSSASRSSSIWLGLSSRPGQVGQSRLWLTYGVVLSREIMLAEKARRLE